MKKIIQSGLWALLLGVAPLSASSGTYASRTSGTYDSAPYVVTSSGTAPVPVTMTPGARELETASQQATVSATATSGVVTMTPGARELETAGQATTPSKVRPPLPPLPKKPALPPLPTKPSTPPAYTPTAPPITRKPSTPPPAYTPPPAPPIEEEMSEAPVAPPTPEDVKPAKKRRGLEPEVKPMPKPVVSTERGALLEQIRAGTTLRKTTPDARPVSQGVVTKPASSKPAQKGDLLAEIRAGKKLKPVQPVERREVEETGLGAIIKRGLGQRREAVQPEASEWQDPIGVD